MDNFNVSKGHRGWEAVTDIPLNEALVLEIHTGKFFYGGVRSQASVMLKGGGISGGYLSDYTKAIIKTDARCTQKAVTETHKQALGLVDKIRDDAIDYYRKMMEKGCRVEDCEQILALLKK